MIAGNLSGLRDLDGDYGIERKKLDETPLNNARIDPEKIILKQL